MDALIVNGNMTDMLYKGVKMDCLIIETVHFQKYHLHDIIQLLLPLIL